MGVGPISPFPHHTLSLLSLTTFPLIRHNRAINSLRSASHENRFHL